MGGTLMRRYLISLLLVWALGACGTVGTSPQPQTRTSRDTALGQARVSLELFSGREPPTWDLSPDNTQKLLDLVAALPASSRAVPVRDLGEYGGFFVNLPDGRVLRIYKGVVTSTIGNTVSTFEDPSQELERLLVDSTKGQIPEDLYAQVVSQANLP